MYSLQLSGRKWLLVISLRQLYTCPLPGICPGQRFTASLKWLNTWGMNEGTRFGRQFLRAMELYKNPEEETGTF
jgi:hypothetical protein